MDLGRDARTSTQSRRLVRRKGANAAGRTRALRASPNHKEDCMQRAGSIILPPPPSKVETVHETTLKPDFSRFCVRLSI